MYAGLLLQTLALAAALCLLGVAYVRAGKADRKYGYTTFHRDGTGYVSLSPKLKTFLAVLPLAGVCTLVRCAYRSAAVWGGLGSDTARDEVLWLAAEGVMLTEAMVSLAVFHPAIWLEDSIRRRSSSDDMEQGDAGTSKLGKRLTAATFATEMDEPHDRDSRHDLDASQVLFSTNLMAPSDESSQGSASRRSSAYGHEQLYQTSPYDPQGESAGRYSEDITSESRGLSPLEAEEEEFRQEAESFIQPPRKSSKRMSRILQQQREAEMEAAEAAESEDRFEVESVMLPSRKPSRRDTVRRRDDELEDVALTSTYSQSVYSQ